MQTLLESQNKIEKSVNDFKAKEKDEYCLDLESKCEEFNEKVQRKINMIK